MVESYMAAKLAAATWTTGANDPISRSLGSVTQLKYWVEICHLPTAYLKVWFRLEEQVDGGAWADLVPPEPFVVTDATLHHQTWVTPPFDPEDPIWPYLSCVYTAFAETVIEPALLAGHTVTQRFTPLKFSYLPGYEPDISDPLNPQPDGFPDPAWEPAAP
jgi:hypothetical protein